MSFSLELPQLLDLYFRLVRLLIFPTLDLIKVYWNNSGYSTEPEFLPLEKKKIQEKNTEVSHSPEKFPPTRRNIQPTRNILDQREKKWFPSKRFWPTRKKIFSTNEINILSYREKMTRQGANTHKTRNPEFPEGHGTHEI